MGRFSLIRGDITKLKVDAIVNAANSHLRGGGGVDGAIRSAAGEKLVRECQEIIKKIKFVPAGEAVATSGGNLPCKYVIHTVGPIWQGGNSNEAQNLASAYRNSLRLAKELGVKSIAFPNISTGVYGFPKNYAAKIATDTVYDFLKNDDSIDLVIFVCFDSENYLLYDLILSDEKFKSL